MFEAEHESVPCTEGPSLSAGGVFCNFIFSQASLGIAEQSLIRNAAAGRALKAVRERQKAGVEEEIDKHWPAAKTQHYLGTGLISLRFFRLPHVRQSLN